VGDGSSAFFLYLGFAGSANAELEIRGGDVEAVFFSLDQQVGKDRNSGLALHHALCGIELIQERGF
jgi:hypothetical protein